MWSLNKPTSNKYTSKVAGSYSLTPNGVNDLYFMENSRKDTIVGCFKSLRGRNPKGVILLMIDNFSSHRSTLVKDEALKLIGS